MIALLTEVLVNVVKGIAVGLLLTGGLFLAAAFWVRRPKPQPYPRGLHLVKGGRK